VERSRRVLAALGSLAAKAEEQVIGTHLT